MCQVVGIAGASCSGKSLLTESLRRRLGSSTATALEIDAYYRSRGELEGGALAAINFDEPRAIDFALLFEQLRRLVRGQAIDVPHYDFATHSRSSRRRRVEPRPVVLVEGLFALYWPELRRLANLRVFLDTPSHVCLARRLERDVRSRGRDAASVQAQFMETVQPMYERYVRPTRRFAHLVLQGEADVASNVSRGVAALALP